MNALCDNNYMPCVPYRLKQLLYLTILIEFHTLLDIKMKARSKPVLIPIFYGHSVVFKISLKFCWDEISAYTLQQARSLRVLGKDCYCSLQVLNGHRFNEVSKWEKVLSGCVAPRSSLLNGRPELEKYSGGKIGGKK